MTTICTYEDLHGLEVQGAVILDKDGDRWTWDTARWVPDAAALLNPTGSDEVINYAPLQVLNDPRSTKIGLTAEQARMIVLALNRIITQTPLPDGEFAILRDKFTNAIQEHTTRNE